MDASDKRMGQRKNKHEMEGEACGEDKGEKLDGNVRAQVEEKLSNKRDGNRLRR